MLDLRLLHHALTLARHRNFARAAQALLGLPGMNGFEVAGRLRALAACPLITAAAPSTQQPRAWDLVIIKRGRLVASACVPHGPRLRPALDALVATAPSIDDAGNGLPLAHIDEALAVLAWLERPGVRLAEVPRARTLTELEFHMPAPCLRARRLRCTWTAPKCRPPTTRSPARCWPGC